MCLFCRKALKDETETAGSTSIPIATVVTDVPAVTVNKVQPPAVWTEKFIPSPEGTPTRTLFSLPSDAPTTYIKRNGKIKTTIKCLELDFFH